jgi:LytS/YehU family sensor histidine kinase
MRYLLYDSEQGYTTLYKEIDFIENYVDLMRLRFSEKVKIELSFLESIPDIKIPPMLFTSLVENALKHGVSYQSESFIGIYLRIQEKYLIFRIKNTLNKNKEAIEKGGLGLKNLSKRLELIYSSRFELNSSENDTAFEVIVKIPINGN